MKCNLNNPIKFLSAQSLEINEFKYQDKINNLFKLHYPKFKSKCNRNDEIVLSKDIAGIRKG
jgi:hypothetical protein